MDLSHIRTASILPENKAIVAKPDLPVVVPDATPKPSPSPAIVAVAETVIVVPKSNVKQRVYEFLGTITRFDIFVPTLVLSAVITALVYLRRTKTSDLKAVKREKETIDNPAYF